MFVEAWAAANGYNVTNHGIGPWRRRHMTNMVNAFDFENPDYSLPVLTPVRMPEPRNDSDWMTGDLELGSLTGPWVGAAKCLAGFSHGNYPAVPYGKSNTEQDMDGLVEDGFKQIRGSITKGRYVTIESEGLGLAGTQKGNVIGLQATKNHDDVKQRWILHSADDNRFGNTFYLQSALKKLYISNNATLTAKKSEARAFVFEYQAKGSTYTLRASGAADGKYIGFRKSINPNRKCSRVKWEGDASQFKVYGVNYRSGN